MKERNSNDTIDQIILGKLSLYESLDLLELWYEIGEDDLVRERVTKQEISGRLEALRARGLVECLAETEGHTRWVLKRGEVNR